jgi:hypothetical protein
MHRLNRIAYRTAFAVALLVTWQPRPSLGGTPCLAFTEIMNNPAAVPDASGEWFEIANYSSMVLNLVGLTIADGVGGSFTIARALMVNPGGMLVFGRSTDPWQMADFHESTISFRVSPWVTLGVCSIFQRGRR